MRKKLSAWKDLEPAWNDGSDVFCYFQAMLLDLPRNINFSWRPSLPLRSGFVSATKPQLLTVEIHQREAVWLSPAPEAPFPSTIPCPTPKHFTEKLPKWLLHRWLSNMIHPHYPDRNPRHPWVKASRNPFQFEYLFPYILQLPVCSLFTWRWSSSEWAGPICFSTTIPWT